MTAVSRCGAVLYGFAGNDALIGTAANDILTGGSGNDIISVSNGVDLLADGGNDDDRIILGAVSFSDGVLLGGKGIDLFDLEGQATFTGRRFAAAEAGFENLYNYYDYRIFGSSGANVLDFSGLTATSRSPSSATPPSPRAPPLSKFGRQRRRPA